MATCEEASSSSPPSCHTFPSPVLVHSKPSSSACCIRRHQRRPSLDLLGQGATMVSIPGMAHAVTPPPSSTSSGGHHPGGHRAHHLTHQRNLSLDSAMRVLNPPGQSTGGDTADRRSLASDDSGIFNSDDGDRTSRVIVEMAAVPAAIPPSQLSLRPPVPGVIDEVHSPVSLLEVGSSLSCYLLTLAGLQTHTVFSCCPLA